MQKQEHIPIERPAACILMPEKSRFMFDVQMSTNVKWNDPVALNAVGRKDDFGARSANLRPPCFVLSARPSRL
jgi:hypothetical protein